MNKYYNEVTKKEEEKYDKKSIKGVYLKLNKVTDADILAKLDQVENRQGYIKDLIRKDIVKNEK